MVDHETIRAEVASVLDRAVRLRRMLHQVPEGAFAETATARIVADELASLGLDVQTGLAGTGVAATITGRHTGPLVALRADMDALAVTEATGTPYASRHEGLAHCCGHDGHMAAVLGAAGVLSRLSERLAGSVRLVFQPAEETGAGAQAMLAAGVFGGLKPAAVLALHGWPGLPTGVVAARSGVMASASDVFEISVHGRGGHGARPARACSPIVPAARLVEALSRLTAPPDDPVPRVVSVGSIHGGGQPNVIPDTAVLSGTIRSADAKTRGDLHRQVRETIQAVARDSGVRAEVTIRAFCPRLENDPGLYAAFAELADGLLGPDQRVELDRPSMGAEDFGYYLQHAPGLLIRLGMGLACPDLHNPAFDFDDGALSAGISVLVGLALRVCDRHAGRTGAPAERSRP